jgi:hypothetical protein
VLSRPGRARTVAKSGSALSRIDPTFMAPTAPIEKNPWAHSPAAGAGLGSFLRKQGWVVVFVASHFSSTDVSMSFCAAGDYDREMRDAPRSRSIGECGAGNHRKYRSPVRDWPAPWRRGWPYPEPRR